MKYLLSVVFCHVWLVGSQEGCIFSKISVFQKMKYSLSVVFVTYDLFGNIVFHSDELPEASFCIFVYQHLEVVHWYQIACAKSSHDVSVSIEFL